MIAIPWDVGARIVIRQGNEPSEWEGSLAECLDVWMRLSAVAQNNAEIFVASPVLGQSTISPGMMQDLVSQASFRER
jgi:hypothetical protein